MFYKKIAKIRDVKMLKNRSITTRNNAVNYYQTLKEVRWLLRLEKPKIDKLQKTWKNASFIQKFA